MTSRRNGTLYLGVTSNLVQRVCQHREKSVPGFTSKYGVVLLVWFERHDSMNSAIHREKCIKSWKRVWKLKLIERQNPVWRDSFPDLLEGISGFRPSPE
jgi:putative endonuclease